MNLFYFYIVWLCEEIVCSFFNIPFKIFWPKYKFGLGWFGLVVYDYLFTSQRESRRYGFFCYTITWFVPFGVIENRVTKINFKYFNGNCNYSSCVVGQFYFYMHQPIKPWLFETIIFWASLSLHIHTVLKSFVSY